MSFALSLVLSSLVLCGASPSSYSYSSSSSSRQGGGRWRFPFGGAWAGSGGAYAGSGGAYAGPGGGYARPGGAFAGTGFPMYYPWVPPFSYTPFYPVFDNWDWTKGDNVCVEKKTMDMKEFNDWFKEVSDNGDSMSSSSSSSESESCRDNSNVRVCTKKSMDNGVLKMTATKFQCCYGHKRNPDGAGCIEIDLRNILPTLRIMGASEMVTIVERVGLSETLHNDNFTIFCPLNSALESLREQIENDVDNNILVKLNPKKLKTKSVMHRLVSSHMTSGFLRLSDFRDDEILRSEDSTTPIRINIYYVPQKIVTANCVPILSADHFARNGIIHRVERTLLQPTKTVADIVAGDSQFKFLKGMLSRAGLVQALRNVNGSYTLFAPTDSAFSSSFPLQHYDGGNNGSRCEVSIIKHHIVNHVICSSALPIYARSMNLIGELLSLTRDEHNKLYVDGVQIVVRDLMALNGVVHVIDGVLTTRQAKTVSAMLEESGLNEYLNLIQIANLTHYFESMENVTFFVPADEAIKDISPLQLESFFNHTDTAREILLYHIANGQTELNVPEQLLHTQLENATIRIQVHTKHPQMSPHTFVQCATVLSADIKLCGGTLHVINRLLLPPKRTIVEFLESVEGFSTLVLLLRATGLERRLNAHTLLAPTDDAFYTMGDEALFRILEDIHLATDLVRMHILPGVTCCSQLAGHRQARAMDGSLLSLQRSVEGSVLIGNARIVDCDIMATNGIVHMVDGVVRHDENSILRSSYTNNVFVTI